MTPGQTSALLSALSSELDDMKATVEGLSTIVLDHARMAPAADRARVIAGAQSVDGLGQRLDALQVLAADLALGYPIDAALGSIPLAALADRLRRAVHGGDVQPSPARAGDLMLFD